MLDNTISLSVDLLNNGTEVVVDYTRFDVLANRSIYNSPDNTYVSRDTLGLYRTLPKRSGNSLGVKKSAIKLTQDQVISGLDGTNLTAPALLDISFALPVGTLPAVAMIMRQRAIALLDDDTFMNRLTNDLEY